MKPRPQRTERPMPLSDTQRELAIRTAVEQLDREYERLARMGLYRQADACRRERRYWEFVGAVLRLAPLSALDGSAGAR